MYTANSAVEENCVRNECENASSCLWNFCFDLLGFKARARSEVFRGHAGSDSRVSSSGYKTLKVNDTAALRAEQSSVSVIFRRKLRADFKFSVEIRIRISRSL
jgi:hypothetical protein